MLRPHIDYVHIKDAWMETGEVTVVCQGDGDLRETVRALRDSGFQGFFSMEPHLAKAEAFSGFSGGEKFIKAVQALKQMVREEGVELAYETLGLQALDAWTLVALGNPG